MSKKLFILFFLFILSILSLPACSSPEKKILKQDRLLQQAAREILGEKRGAVILMDPQSGRIRAMVNRPWAVEQAFSPGSTFKIITALAALESGKISPRREIICKGKAAVGGISVRCHDPRGHGAVNLEAALAHSCNIYFYTIGREVGKEPILYWARELGLGQPLTLEGGGAAGTLWEPRNTEELLNLAVGDWEGVQVTPLQLLRAYVAVAGKGELVSPYLADTAEELKSKNHPPAKALNPGPALEPIQRGLRYSVFLGTAKQSQGKSYDLLAKTGTATIRGGWGTHAWFLGVAPAQEPKIALVVFLWRGTGAKDAASVAQKILEAWEKIES
jgi:cell division protein FtsI/penicillin-binding protein 2